MSGQHTPQGDRSFLVSVARHLSAAVALVLVVAAAFWGIGQFRGEQPDPVIHATPPTASPDAADDDPATERPSPTDDPGAESSPSPPATTAPSPSATAEPAAGPDPATVSVQVLDAVLSDGGEAADDLTRRLRDDGYRVVATNRAVRAYEATTVFYSPGHEAAGQQVAEAYGFSEVDEKPDNLSSGVDVHVVVGRDYQPE